MKSPSLKRCNLMKSLDVNRGFHQEVLSVGHTGPCHRGQHTGLGVGLPAVGQAPTQAAQKSRPA